ncbi:MAG TPA: carbohydrate-binding module family 20 domain-containing protein [Herpetosiphonaceae bacterium]
MRPSSAKIWRCVSVLFLLLGMLAQPRAAQAQAVTSPRTVMVHLFEWKWTDVAQECERFLGPKGFAAVQVSPPQEHVQGAQWWTRYQPVSYRIESRGGTRAQFQDMVTRCKNVGVDIYVDAVINHMSGSDNGGTGWAGSSFQHYVYPGIYQNQDFHHCGRNGDDNIANYGDRWEVQNCELVNLADLNTGAEYVRGRLAAYMNDLRSMGVAGFRIDAAKHIATGDINNIVGRLSNSPYIYQEVIDQGGEPITAAEYNQNGDVTEFKYSVKVSETFYSGKLDWLSNWGEGWGFMASDKAVAFVNNHDNQRGHGGGGHIVNFKDGQLHDLANVFMLAHPYGYPQIMSSYNFTNGDQGPPAGTVYASGATNPSCITYSPSNPGATGWVCEHRIPEIANMVGFHNYTTAYNGITDWWSNGNNQIAFGRGDRGYVAINREGAMLSRTFQTRLSPGVYCNAITSHKNGSSCVNTATGGAGQTVTVNAYGEFTATIAAMDAVAIHGGAKISSPATASVSFNGNATTVMGQNVYVVGNVTALGNWDTSRAVLLSSASYPVWKGTVTIPASTAVQYKYIKKDGAGNVIWEGGSNRAFTTPASGTATRNDTWQP